MYGGYLSLARACTGLDCRQAAATRSPSYLGRPFVEKSGGGRRLYSVYCMCRAISGWGRNKAEREPGAKKSDPEDTGVMRSGWAG